MLTAYIWTLPQQVQQDIRTRLELAGIEGDDLELALDGRVCDLEDTIDIRDWR